MPQEQVDRKENLLRRVSEHLIRDDGTLSSSAFKQGGSWETNISVDVESLTDRQTSVDRAGRSGFFLAVTKAQSVFSLDFDVRHDRQSDNQAHALIIGTNDKATSKRLAANFSVIDGVKSRNPIEHTGTEG